MKVKKNWWRRRAWCEGARGPPSHDDAAARAVRLLLRNERARLRWLLGGVGALPFAAGCSRLSIRAYKKHTPKSKYNCDFFMEGGGGSVPWE